NREIAERFPGRITIAEDLQHNPRLTQGIGQGGAGFASQWDPSFLCAMRAAVAPVFDECRPLYRVKEAIGSTFNQDAWQRIIYTESHDDVANTKPRLPAEIDRSNPGGWHAQKRATLATALALTAPGVPMLFQGQEFLEPDSFSDAVPLDWERARRHAGIV